MALIDGEVVWSSCIIYNEKIICLATVLLKTKLYAI